MDAATENDSEFTVEERRLIALLGMHDAVVLALGFQWGDLPVDRRPILTAVECLRPLAEDDELERLASAVEVQSAIDAYLTESTPERYAEAVAAYNIFVQLGEDVPCPTLH